MLAFGTGLWMALAQASSLRLVEVLLARHLPGKNCAAKAILKGELRGECQPVYSRMRQGLYVNVLT